MKFLRYFWLLVAVASSFQAYIAADLPSALDTLRISLENLAIALGPVSGKKETPKPGPDSKEAVLDELAHTKLDTLSEDAFRDLVDRMVKFGLENSRDKNHDTILTAAIKKGYNNFIAEYPTLGQEDADAALPLILAVQNDNLNQVTRLLRFNSPEFDYIEKRYNDKNAIDYASENNKKNTHNADAIWRQFANIVEIHLLQTEFTKLTLDQLKTFAEQLAQFQLQDRKDKNHDTLLTAAIKNDSQKGYGHLVKELIDKKWGAVSAVEPLILAVQKGNTSLVQRLVEANKAEPDYITQKDESGKTVVDYVQTAVTEHKRNAKEILNWLQNHFKQLLTQGKGLKELKSESLMTFAEQLFLFKLQDNQDRNGDTLLTAAIENGYKDVAANLINKRWGRISAVEPLILAVQKDNQDIVKLLVDANRSVSNYITQKDAHGKTALDYANNNVKAKKSHAQDILKLLQPEEKKVAFKETASFRYPTFNDWYGACVQDLKLHSDIGGQMENEGYKEGKKKVLGYDELVTAFLAYRDLVKAEFEAQEKWLNGSTPPNLFPHDITEGGRKKLFEPFVVKKIFNASSRFYIHGDLHGDVHSLLHAIRYMQSKGDIKKDSFEIKNSDLNLLFLGDTVDRGIYSLETFYTLIRLKLANPDNVFIVRGNHENWDLAKDYGLWDEITISIPETDKQDSLFNAFINYFNLLPSALFLGCASDYVQCCHGGIEVGYNPKALLSSDKTYEYIAPITKLQKEDNIKAMGLSTIKDVYTKELDKIADIKFEAFYFGLMWSDFFTNNTSMQVAFKEGRGATFNKDATEKYFAFASNQPKGKLQGILRAHQHSDIEKGNMMSLILNAPDNVGIAKLWEASTPENKNKLWPGIVCTFNISPNTYWGNRLGYFKDFGTNKGVVKDFWGELNVAQKFDDWRLKAFEIDQPVKK